MNVMDCSSSIYSKYMSSEDDGCEKDLPMYLQYKYLESPKVCSRFYVPVPRLFEVSLSSLSSSDCGYLVYIL